MPVVRTVSVGRPRESAWIGDKATSIEKLPVIGPVEVSALGLEGDQVSDTIHHGGLDQAVYVYAREDLDRWVESLDRPIRDGQFGENLTTSGIDVNAAEVGERWRIGTALFEVASVRTPCYKFQAWMGVSGFDNAQWVRRFAAEGRPGPYLRVLEAGRIAAGDELTVLHRPGHGVSVSMLFRALTFEPALLPRLLDVDGLIERARHKAEAYVAART
ncbi:MAG: MOSC domain-containing protein [Actinomycetota bacterium]|nr:MOSC domain-containing protein [Actinomycetota bacterium]